MTGPIHTQLRFRPRRLTMRTPTDPGERFLVKVRMIGRGRAPD